MSSTTTRSKIDLSKIKIDTLEYIPPSRLPIKQKMTISTSSNEVLHDENQLIEIKPGEDVKAADGHELNDQFVDSQPTHRDLIKEELQTFEKFTGGGDAEQWLTSLLKKFELLQVDMDDRIAFIPSVITGEAFIWFVQNEQHMMTFISFAKLFLQRFASTKMEGRTTTSTDLISNQQQLIITNGLQDDVFSSLRNQMLLSHIEK
ncbi:unnamed protein product, partial [Adineta steineri]